MCNGFDVVWNLVFRFIIITHCSDIDKLFNIMIDLIAFLCSLRILACTTECESVGL